MAAMDTADMLIVSLLLQGVFLALTGRLLLPYIVTFMTVHGLIDRNFRGDSIPTSCGLLIWLLVLVEAVLQLTMNQLFGPGSPASDPHVSLLMTYSMCLSAVAILGFMDDAIGMKEVKGISGHWRLWKERKLVSTGLLKAAVTLLAAWVFVVQETAGSFIHGVCQTILLMLLTNGMNLMDLRPGRALKCFFSLGVLCITAAVWLFPLNELREGNLVGLELVPLVLPVMIGAWILFGPDLQGKLMLGDTGANLLGFAGGCWLILSAGWLLQTAALLVLVLLHLVTWRFSLSRLIERNRLLNWIDLLGRRGGV